MGVVFLSVPVVVPFPISIPVAVGMDPRMTSEFIRAAKPFLATWVCAHERFFACVGADVAGLDVGWG